MPDDVWRELIHQPSSIQGLTYELAPDCSQFSHGALVKTNSYGMRDDEPVPLGEKLVQRIVVCGDSYTFGFGVAGEEAYPNVLEKRLNEMSLESHYDVLNMGVTAYCTRDEALLLIHRGFSWNPILVIVGDVLNDPDCGPQQPLRRYFQEPRWWQHSNILRLVAGVRYRREVKRLGNGDYIRYLHSPEQEKWQKVLAAFEDIRAATIARDIPVLLLVFPMIKEITTWSEYPYFDLHQQVAAAGKSMGFDVIDLYDAFSQHSIDSLRLAEGHPNSRGHALTAEVIEEWLVEESGLVQ